MLSLIGLASTTTISWTGLGLSIVTEINAGGPSAIIYGFILVTMMQSFLGASLAEFVSSYPTEGGMYHWIAAVAPKKLSAFLSFITGWLTVAGCMYAPYNKRQQLTRCRDIHHRVDQPDFRPDRYVRNAAHSSDTNNDQSKHSILYTTHQCQSRRGRRLSFTRPSTS